jgi:hypothetical protein
MFRSLRTIFRWYFNIFLYPYKEFKCLTHTSTSPNAIKLLCILKQARAKLCYHAAAGRARSVRQRGCGLEGRSSDPGRCKGFPCSSQFTDKLCGSPRRLPVGNSGSVSGLQRLEREADRSSSSEVKKRGDIHSFRLGCFCTAEIGPVSIG